MSSHLPAFPPRPPQFTSGQSQKTPSPALTSPTSGGNPGSTQEPANFISVPQNATEQHIPYYYPPVTNTYNQPVKKTSHWIVVLVSIFFLLALATAGWLYVQNSMLNTQLVNLQQEKEIKEEELQRKLDAKETFSATTTQLLEELNYFTGMPVKEKFAVAYYQQMVTDAYLYRDDIAAVNGLTSQMKIEIEKIQTLKTQMDQNKTSNVTNSPLETTADALSNGYAEIVFYTMATPECQDTNINESSVVAACVWNTKPQTIYVNTDVMNRTVNQENNGWYYQGVVYHEYAHVLQYTNPETTATYLPSFDNDSEKQADCFADAYYASNFSEYSYNKGCTVEQVNKVQEWYETLKFQPITLTQQN